MPFLDPEELKPKLREVFETVVIPQIKKAKMKQTAVEWLAKEICYISIDGKYIVDNAEDVTHIVEQAKAMEKEQIIDAWKNGDNEFDEVANTFSEKYYNETFKS